jgi:hypothetical protein
MTGPDGLRGYCRPFGHVMPSGLQKTLRYSIGIQGRKQAQIRRGAEII